MFWLWSGKALLVGLVGLFAVLVGYNNIVDYGSNFAFVQHVLSMDDTFPDNQLRSRAILNTSMHHVAYWGIIAMELITGVLCLCAAGLMALATTRQDNNVFQGAKRFANAGLCLGLLLWFGGFLVIGAEWFLMWQSANWNGQEAAFRFAALILGILIFVNQAEPL